jgi:predicted short-subunit dehydrogenase-like oxidoreductase (DUF2520 family)
LRSYALAGAGAVSRSFIPRLPNLRRDLGPVASGSYRLASRMANALGAGVPVREMGELDSSALLLICGPRGCIPELVTSLMAAGLSWHGKTVVLCDSDEYSSDFPEFRKRGAVMASVNPIEGFANRYVVEGDHIAVRDAKVMVKELGGKAVEVEADKMMLYGAALTLTSSLFTPLIESTMDCIRSSGIEAPVATRIAEALLRRSLRAYMHSGRKSWSGPVAEADEERLDREFAELSRSKPLLARYYRHSSDFAKELYQSFPELTRMWSRPQE